MAGRTAMADALSRTVQEWRDKVAASGARSWPEWIGSTPDAAIPAKVRARIVLVWGMVCHITGAPIIGERPEFEHVVPLHAGGANREGNIRPVSKRAHKAKSAEEITRKAKADAQRRAAVVKREPKRRIASPPKAERVTTKLDQIRALGAGEIARRFQ